jgi:hypothetical protein
MLNSGTTNFALCTTKKSILPLVLSEFFFLNETKKHNPHPFQQNRIFSQKVGNKLRTYKLFKEVFETEMYLSKNIPSRYRSAFAKFRCGVAPLRIETGCYENKNVNVQFSKKLTIHQEYKKLFLLLKILKRVLATIS